MPKKKTPPSTQAFEATSFLFGSQADYIESLYARYLKNDPKLDSSWSTFFIKIDPKRQGHMANMHDAIQMLMDKNSALKTNHLSAINQSKSSNSQPSFRREEKNLTARKISQETLDTIRALMLIRAYRVRGHLYANLDPLNLQKIDKYPELEPEKYGFGSDDLDRSIYIDNVLGKNKLTMREILKSVKKTYCGTIGVEFMHIQHGDQKSWIQESFENLNLGKAIDTDTKQKILQELRHAEMFEQFLNIKYPGAKRFGLDGAESLIPCINEIIEQSAVLGVKEVVLGMAHRGRLNLLANILQKPLEAIFSEFLGNSNTPDNIQGDGDVKYHVGTSSDRFYGKHKVHLSLLPNPSHLEAIDPVVLGKVRAKQDHHHDTIRQRVLGLLIHGDAAFSGQGLVAESLSLSQLSNYKTGGTIHIIINNQIGFTTCPSHSRSSPYCSDLAKTIQAPILHVNGDDPDMLLYAAKIAAEFRHRFSSDIVIDLYCYRRHGHNEGDEPMFTQPSMYKAIAKHPTVYQIYKEKLIDDNLINQEQTSNEELRYKQLLEKSFDKGSTFKPQKADWLEGKWTNIHSYDKAKNLQTTGVSVDKLKLIGSKLTYLPPTFHPHAKIERFLQNRASMFETGQGFDWSTAEALAFGTLLQEKYPVRLSGQDSSRGTFSQRHAVLHDQRNDHSYTPLNHISNGQAHFDIVDSPLAEASILGFEYGYASADPNTLVLWEAQFGDFANGAQVIIDQFIASGESKWLRMNGLVLLLPHGYEGQGPEHSSARIERYLQLCAQDNIQVLNCSTPANYFHALRRQLHRTFRKPLIIFTPKSLLRLKTCVSKLTDFSENTVFCPVLDDLIIETKTSSVKKIILCSGKVYYDLLKERTNQKLMNIAIIRIEQLYPFPHDDLTKILQQYPPNAQVIWCQEEPQNMGPWFFMDRRLETVLQQLDFVDTRPHYVGRPAAASTATGTLKRHLTEQLALVQQALTPTHDQQKDPKNLDSKKVQ